MAVFADYSALSDALLAWINLTTDQAGVTATRIEEAVKLAEGALIRNLRSFEAQTTVTGSTSTSEYVTTIALPADWIAGKELELYDNGYWYPLPETGGAAVVHGGDSTIEIRPSLSSDLTYKLRYWAKFSSIAGSSSASNWVLANHPDAYLVGAKMWLHRFMQDEQAAQTEETRFIGIVEELRASSISREWFILPQAVQGGGTP